MRRFLRVLSAGVFMALSTPLAALPTESSVASGSVDITQEGMSMIIEQHSDKAIIEWGEYSIAHGETLQYIQPGVQSIALNRITGANPSEILGSLIANGKIFVINPHGVLFGPDSHVNVAGLLATTLNISDSSFLDERYEFFQNNYADLAAVINKGEIVISDNGYAILVAPMVSNEGLIVANLGTVQVGAAEQFTVNFDGSNLVNFTIMTPPAESQPGTVLIPTGQVSDIIRQVVNFDGLIAGAEIVEENGVTRLVASSGVAINSGTIIADGAEKQNAGIIGLTATQATVNLVDGLLSASGVGVSSSGGSIAITAPIVGQHGGIHADAEEGNGGDIDIYASELAVFTPESSTTANAGSRGNGGDVVLFSPKRALFWNDASIEAKGGTLSGDGGFVETSGRTSMELYTTPDITAPNGVSGEWLIDPEDITISDGASANITPFSFPGTYICFPTNDNITTVLNVATLNAALNAGGTVSVLTDNGNTPGGTTTPGSITVDAEISKTGGALSTLKLLANSNIVVNSPIGSTSGVLNVFLGSGTPGGTVDINNTITTNGGYFQSNGIDFDNTGGAITTSGGALILGPLDPQEGHSGAVIIGAPLSSGSGDVAIYSSGSTVLIQSTVDTTTGDVSIDSSGTTTVTADGIITTAGGSVTFGAAQVGDLVISADISTGAGGAITFNNAVSVEDAVTFDAGDHTFNNVSTISGGTHDITIVADSVTIGGTITTSGVLSVQPSTLDSAIGIADGATGAFHLSTAEMGRLQSSTNTIIGSATGTGSVDVRALTYAYPITIQSPGIGGDITVTGAFTTEAANKPITLRAGTGDSGLFTMTEGTIASGSGAISITADVVALNTITGTGTLVLQPATAARPLVIGAAGSASDFALSTEALASLTDGFSGITIGRADGTGSVSVYAATFTDPVTIQSGSAGDITLMGALSSVGAIALDAGAGTIDNGGFVLDAGAGTVRLTSDGIVLSGADTIRTTGAVKIEPFNVNAALNIAHGAGGYELTTESIAAIKDGASSITLGRDDGEHAIAVGAITFNDPVTIQTPAGGSITVNGQITGAGDTSVTLHGSGSTTTLNADIVTAGEAIAIDDSVLLGAATITLDSASGVPAGADITITGSVNSIGGARSLSINAGSDGDITLTGAVGNTGVLDVLTVTNSKSTTCSSTVSAATVALTDTTGTIAFQDSVTLTTGLTTAEQGYALSIAGTSSSIAGTTTFLNTGALTLGSASGDSTTFVGGVTATAPSSLNIAGTIAATSGASTITLGDVDTGVVVTADSTVGGGATGIIEMSDVTIADGAALTIGTGISNAINLDAVTGTGGGAVSDLIINTTGVVAIDGTVGTDIGVITITQSGGTTFSSTVDAATVTVTDTTGTIAFEDNLTVTTGLTAAAQEYSISIMGASNSIAGTTTFLNTGALTIGSASGDSTTFVGGVTATAPSSLNIAGTIAATTGTSTLTLGDADSAVAVTADSTVGGAATGAIDMGVVTLATGKTLTVGTGIGNDVAIGGVTGAGAGDMYVVDFEINTQGTVVVSGGVDIADGTVMIMNSGGTTFEDSVSSSYVSIYNTTGVVAFEGDLTVSTGFIPTALSYDIAIRGSNNSIAGETTFANTGTTTIGNASTDSTTFGGGVDASHGPLSIAGNISTIDADMTLGVTTLTGNTVLDAGTGGVSFTKDVGIGSFDLTVAHSHDTTVDDVLFGEGGITGSGDVDITATDMITISKPLALTGSGMVTLRGPTTIQHTHITTEGGDINFNGAVLLDWEDSSDPTVIGTSAGAGDILFASTLDGLCPLVLTAGEGDITFSGAVGGSAPLLESVEIVSAHHVTATTFNVASITQDAGTGTTQFNGAVAVTRDNGDGNQFDITTAAVEMNDTIVTGAGNVSVNATTSVVLAEGKTITTTAAADTGISSGAVDINVSGSGTVALLGDIITTGADNSSGVGSSGGAVTIDTAGGVVSIHSITTSGGAGSDSNAGGAAGLVTIATTSDSITLNSDITAGGGGSTAGAGGAGGGVTFSDGVVLAAAVRVDTSGGVGGTTQGNGGNVGFLSTLDGAQTLGITAGTGNVVFGGIVGGVTELGAMTIVSAADVTATTITAASVTQEAGTGVTTLNGAVTTSAAEGISLRGTDLAVNGSITTTGAGMVTFIEESSITIAAAGDTTSVGYVSMIATGGISISGLSLGEISLAVLQSGSVDAAITIEGDITSDTDCTVVVAGDAIISGTVNVGGQCIIGATNTIDITGDITTVSDLILYGTGTVTTAGALHAGEDVVIISGSDADTTTSTLTATGDIGMIIVGDLSTAGTLEAGGDVDIMAEGVITTTSDITARGDDGSSLGYVYIEGSGITTAGNISAVDNVELWSDGAVVQNGAIIHAQDVYIDGSSIEVNATISGVAGVIEVTSDAIAITADISGSSTIVLQPATVTTRIGIGDGAGDYSLTAAEIAHLVDGFSGITIGRSDGEHSITIGAVAFNDPVTIRTPASGGSITVNGDITMSGTNDQITLDGSGATTTLNADIITHGGVIDVSDSVLVGNFAVTLDTTSGGNTAGAAITISGTTNSAEGETNPLTLNGGTGGDITLTGAVGDSAPLGGVTIVSAHDVTVSAALSAASFMQLAGTGNTQFGNSVALSAVGGLNLTTNTVTVNNTVDTLAGGNGGSVTITNSGLLTILSGADMTLDGAFTQNGAGIVSTAGNITTTNDDISFATAVTLTGDVDFNTGAGAGTISFLSTLDGAHTLGITAGTGNVVLGGSVGGVTELGAVTIVSAADVTATTIRAASVTQEAGSGTTTLNGALTTTTSDGVSLTGTNLVVNNTITTTGAGTVTFIEENSITTAAAGDITSAGDVALLATGGTPVSGLTLSQASVAIMASGIVTAGMTIDGDITSDSAVGIVAAGDISTSGTFNTGGLFGIEATRDIDTTTSNITAVAYVYMKALGNLNVEGVINAGTGNIDHYNYMKVLAGGTIHTTNTLTATDDVYMNAGGSITVTGTVNAGDDVDMIAGSTVEATNDITAVGYISLEAVGDITTGGVLEAGGDVDFLADGAVTASGDITARGDDGVLDGHVYAEGTNITTAGVIHAADYVQLDGSGAVVQNGAIVSAQDIYFDGSSIEVNAALSSVNGGLSLTSDSIAITADISGSSTILLQPATVTTTIGIGDGAGDYSLAAPEIAHLVDGFSAITIGRSDGEHGITIGAITFNDPVTIRSPVGGHITVDGEIAAAGDCSVTFEGSGSTTYLNAGITTAGEDITIGDNVILGSGLTIRLDTGAASGGNISIDGSVAGVTDGAESLTLISGGGTTAITGSVGTSGVSLGTLTLQADDGASTGSVQFDGNVFVTAITTYPQNYNISFLGDVEVTDATTFLNTGTVTLGDNESDSIVFTHGVDLTQGPSSVTAIGTITVTDGPITFGDVAVTGPMTVDVGTGDAIFNGTINGAGYGITVIGNSAVTGAEGLLIADTLDITTAAGIGSASGLATQVLGVTATNNTSGDIWIRNNTVAGVTGDLTVGSAGITNDGGSIRVEQGNVVFNDGVLSSIDYTTGGDLFIAGTIEASQGVTLHAIGSILDRSAGDSGFDIIAGATSEIMAFRGFVGEYNGVQGTSGYEPLEVDIRAGNLYVYGSVDDRPVVVTIVGAVDDVGVLSVYDDFMSGALTLFNGTINGGEQEFNFYRPLLAQWLKCASPVSALSGSWSPVKVIGMTAFFDDSWFLPEARNWESSDEELYQRAS